MATNFLTRAEEWLLNVLTKFSKKAPTALASAAAKANEYISIAIKLLNSPTAVDLSLLIPETEPARAELVFILTTMQAAFKAVDVSMQQGIITQAGALATASIYNEPVSHPTATIAYLNASTSDE